MAVAEAAKAVFAEASEDVEDMPERPPTEAEIAEAEDLSEPFATRNEQLVTTCQRCGWNVSDDYAPLEKEDFREFVRSTLSGERFTKEMKIYDGAITATFKLRIAVESDMVFAQLEKERRSEKLQTELDYSLALNRYQMATNLWKLETKDGKVLAARQEDFKTATVAEEDLPVVALADKMFADLPEVLYSVVLGLSRTFELLADKLIHSAQNPDFSESDG